MNYNFTVTVPKETEKDKHYYEILKLTKGVITKVIVRIPPGHSNLTGLVLKYHEAQLYPLNSEDYYHGDDDKIDFEDYQPILINPFELKAEAWNTDEEYDHEFIVNLTVIRPEELSKAIPVTSIEAMKALIGYEGEVEA